MEMVVHETEAQNFSEIDSGKTKNQRLEIILVCGNEGKPRQSRSGDDVIYGRVFGQKKPGNAGHDDLRN